MSRSEARADGVIPAVLAAAFLLLAAATSHWPYSFYVIMRFTVCTVSVYLARLSYLGIRQGWAWILGAVAVLFNPVLPIRMHRSDWSVLDIIGALALIAWAAMTHLLSREVNRAKHR